MRFWWVNQKKTYRHEVGGGYLWSPKVKTNGQLNPYYEFMREVAPGDLVFSFSNTFIRALGLVRSYAYEAPQPPQFGAAGRNWSHIGWRVDVSFHERDHPVRPADWIEMLRPLLPAKYSPLRKENGHGLRNLYLTAIPEPLGLCLAELMGPDVVSLARNEGIVEHPLEAPVPESLLWEDHLRRQIEESSLEPTHKLSLVMARRGQGLFRSRVQALEHSCRVTRVDQPEHLRASHCKPWRDCDHAERLDGENGLLLTPSIDHLFDRGFISFADDGRLLTSPVAHGPSLARMGVPRDPSFDVGSFTPGQARFLEYHRDCVFLRARVGSQS